MNSNDKTVRSNMVLFFLIFRNKTVLSGRLALSFLTILPTVADIHILENLIKKKKDLEPNCTKCSEKLVEIRIKSVFISFLSKSVCVCVGGGGGGGDGVKKLICLRKSEVNVKKKQVLMSLNNWWSIASTVCHAPI